MYLNNGGRFEASGRAERTRRGRERESEEKEKKRGAEKEREKEREGREEQSKRVQTSDGRFVVTGEVVRHDDSQ